MLYKIDWSSPIHRMVESHLKKLDNILNKKSFVCYINKKFTIYIQLLNITDYIFYVFWNKDVVSLNPHYVILNIEAKTLSTFQRL